MTKKHVVIIGGGVAGMSAAHELIDNGFRVTVLERASRPGGKARTLDAPNPTATGRRLMPGEHGFRFFPHFYQNVRHTMERIRLGSGPTTVRDNLVPASQAMLARQGGDPIEFPTTGGHTLDAMASVLQRMFMSHNTGLTTADLAYFCGKVLQIMAACPERALDEFEATSWWEYLDADNQSPAFRQYLVEGLTRCLVAAKARDANVRAGGVVLTQLFYGLLLGQRIDWVLNGPTDDAWLQPWYAQLTKDGVDFHLDAEVTAFTVSGNRISGVEVKERGTTVTIPGDCYIGALPVEVMYRLWSPEMAAVDPKFAANLQVLASHVDWMTGIQYFLDVDARITKGHITFIDSPWALTAISQPQFWQNTDLRQYGDGAHLGILSVDISEWECPGVVYGKTAKQCTGDEIVQEVWQQMVDRLNVGGVVRIPAPLPKYRFLDPNIILTPYPVDNLAPLFINKKRSWAIRPTNRTPLSNLYLAADYVRTDTNLATMEAANESARRAVHMIHLDLGVGKPCKWWPLPDPFADQLDMFRQIDCWAYKAGRPLTQPIAFF